MIYGGKPAEKPAEEPQAEAVDPKEEQRFQWRKLRLVRAGFGEENAELLARSRSVDLHRAEAMLEQGCPQGLVLRILL